MRLAVEVKIHNNIYTIHFVQPSSTSLIMNDDEIHSGITDFIAKNIFIRNDLIPDTLRYTLLHEIVHAYIESYGLLQISWNDEIVADFIANYMDDILQTFQEVVRAKEE